MHFCIFHAYIKKVEGVRFHCLLYMLGMHYSRKMDVHLTTSIFFMKNFATSSIADYNSVILSRKEKQENFSRNDVILEKNHIFFSLRDVQLIRISKLLKKVLKDTRYNTFVQISKLAKEKEKTWKNLDEIFNELDFWNYDKNLWTDCYWLSHILKKELDNLWIYSYFIRFDAWGTLNDEYLINGHVGLCIPRNIFGERWFTILDPWMLVAEPITFLDGNLWIVRDVNGLNICIKRKQKWDLSHVLQINSKELFFDPYHKWNNPNQTLSRDLLSCLWSFKIVKQDSKWYPLCYMRVDIANNIITFKVNFTGIKRRIDIPFQDFIEIKKDKELLRIVEELSFVLWEEEFQKFYKEILSVIAISDEYKGKIWVKSTLKNLERLNDKNKL